MGIENVENLKPGQEATLSEDTVVTLPEGTEVSVAEQHDDPHPADESPEELAGEETPDPWSDDTQKDWPNNESEEKS